jgi:hypothetical protein
MARDVQVADHTRIVKAIFENAREVMHNLHPTPVQVLQAALEVEAIDAPTKQVIRQTLAALPDIERSEGLVPPRLRARLNELQRSLLTTQTAEQTRAVLEGARRNGVAASEEEEAWNEGVRVALAIVEDGKDTIYSPAFVEATLRKQGLATVRQDGISPGKAIAGADAAGALGGAIGAFVTGAAIPLIPAAALFGGVAGSAAAGIVIAVSGAS